MRNGLASVTDTLKLMRALIREGAVNSIIRETALNVVAGVPQKDYLGELRAMHSFVKRTIRYTRDVDGVETLQQPIVTLELRHGDCDDHTTLLGALLTSIGHPVNIVAVGPIPGRCSHVYLEDNIRGTWVPAETTEPVNIGWSPKSVSTRLEMNVRSGKQKRVM